MKITSKKQLDDWFSDSYNRLCKELSIKYPKCKNTIEDDLNGFYIKFLEKKIGKVENIEAYLYTYIYQTHYRYYSNTEGYIKKGKKLTIKLYEELPDFIEESDPEFELEIKSKLDMIISDLSIDQYNLYTLYFIEGLVSRDIAELLGCSHSSVAKSVKRLKEYIIDKITDIDE